jgi:uncharacterized protein YyaL (SSP411 family)
MPSNRLIHETSPYLLQHAHNPVDWYPWGEEALERARREDKPILLSIGYSACHWCHVMEHESFEDADVARVMNELFVCIKLDREERPDLDKIYQTAHQLLTGRPGGWPLNMFLAPDDHLPIFGGTYFPKTPRYGMPAFVEVLREIDSIYRNKRDAVREQGAQIADVFHRIAPAAPAPGEEPSMALIDEAYAELRSQFDRTHGGFGGAPKFPHPTSIELMLRQSLRGGAQADEALRMTQLTLTRMADGGLYDHVGGGFARYTVDERWEIPHFEKMLYDNGQLLALYADAARLTNSAHYRRVVAETGEWVTREMQSPEGGYYATLDADSEGHEGKYYVWSLDELRALLSADEYTAVEHRFGLRGQPNFEGQWHLNARAEPADDAAWKLIDGARAKLFAAREKRVRPGRDDKIIASWNGLMIKGMARAGRLLGREDFIASAERAFEFVRKHMWVDGRLRATHKDGRARFAAYLDDYAFLLDGAIDLLQARWRTEHLEFALTLARTLIEHFEDDDRGGFYFTADDHERLAYRPKTNVDEAVPSGNGVAARALLQLGHLVGDLNIAHAGERTVDALHADAARRPSACGSLMTAVEEYLAPTPTVVLRGNAAALPAWQTRLHDAYSPRRLVFAIPDDAVVPGLLAERKNTAAVTAYVCEGRQCRAPMHDMDELMASLA